MPAIGVVADASVALKWFHAEGEAGVDDARRLVELHAARDISLQVLDLTRYELGNALLRGKRVSATAVATVLDALAEICPAVTPTAAELRLAASLAEQHDLTLYDAMYAAVARERGGRLATFDRQLLATGLGYVPEAAGRG